LTHVVNPEKSTQGRKPNRYRIEPIMAPIKKPSIPKPIDHLMMLPIAEILIETPS
jgi:hypothetical protein